MKKILTASLVAMMAVTAANAKIASTKYVDDRTGTATFTADSIKDSANLTAAVETLAGTVATNNTNVTQAIADAKTEITNAYEAADTALDGKITAEKEAREAADTALDTKTTDALALKEDIANRVVNASDMKEDKKSQQYPTIQYFEDELEAELGFATGEVMTEVQELSTALSQEVTNRENADATNLQAAKEYTDAEVKELADGTVANNTAAINAINNETTGILAQAKKHSDDADVLQTTALQQYADQAEADAIAAAKNETTNQVNALANGAVKANADAIAALDTTYAKDADVESAIATAKGEAIADAKAETTSQVTALANGAVKANADAIAALDTTYAKDADVESAIATAKGEAIADAKAETTSQVTALADGAVKTNTDAISELEASLADGGATDARFDAVEETANAAQVKSTADFQFGGANGTWKDITTLPDYCGKTNATCSLVSKDGSIRWELVEY